MLPKIHVPIKRDADRLRSASLYLIAGLQSGAGILFRYSKTLDGLQYSFHALAAVYTIRLRNWIFFIPLFFCFHFVWRWGFDLLFAKGTYKYYTIENIYKKSVLTKIDQHAFYLIAGLKTGAGVLLFYFLNALPDAAKSHFLIPYSLRLHSGQALFLIP